MQIACCWLSFCCFLPFLYTLRKTFLFRWFFRSSYFKTISWAFFFGAMTKADDSYLNSSFFWIWLRIVEIEKKDSTIYEINEFIIPEGLVKSKCNVVPNFHSNSLAFKALASSNIVDKALRWWMLFEFLLLG